LNDFFGFRSLITRTVMIIVYAVGVAAITVGGITLMVAAETGLLRLAGLGILTFGNLFWRVACEADVVMFSIHDLLKEISEKK